MISGCKDTQTSADIGAGSLGVAKAAGAMTTAFRHTVNGSISCEDLLTNMRSYLKRNGFDQVPQMSSDRFVQMDCSYVHYQEKRRGKRDLPPGLAEAAASASMSSPQMPMGGQQMSPQMSQDDVALQHRLSHLEAEIASLRQANSPQGMNVINPGSPMMTGGFGNQYGAVMQTPQSW